MTAKRIESWSDFPGTVHTIEDGRVCVVFEDGRWAMLKPSMVGIALTSFVSLDDQRAVGILSSGEYEAEVEAYEARKAAEKLQGERDYRDAMLKRQERLR